MRHYRDARIRRNRAVVAEHPRWRYVRPERLNLPRRQSSIERYETAVGDATRHLRQAEKLYEKFDSLP